PCLPLTVFSQSLLGIRHHSDGSAVVLLQREHQLRPTLGLNPEKAGKQRHDVICFSGSKQMFAEVLEEVAIVRAGGPTISTLLLVCIEQALMQRRTRSKEFLRHACSKV